MKIKFRVNYKTNWGEELYLSLNDDNIPMRYTENDIWEVNIETTQIVFEYSYWLGREGKKIRQEWKGHQAVWTGNGPQITIEDRWNDRPKDWAFYSSAFTQCAFRREKPIPSSPTAHNLCIRLPYPQLAPNEALAIVGSGKSRGNWTQPIVFSDEEFPILELRLMVREDFEFKFILIDKESKQILQWENEENRNINICQEEDDLHIYNNLEPRLKKETWKGFGTAIPVFSLRSNDSFGVGEFLDLKKIIDWAAMTGQSVIQVLPINDTFKDGKWGDSYPYNAISSFALHAQYINIPNLGISVNEELKNELNSLQTVDYVRVNAEKHRLLRLAYAERGVKDASTTEWTEFLSVHSNWVKPYAVFCALRDEFGSTEHTEWGKFSKFSPKLIDEYAAEHTDEVGYYIFVQYHLDKQLKEVREYARTKRIILKGDLPIGVSRISVDSWEHPELFNMSSQCGAPPDAFASEGQNWGFPTYNWATMAEDNYSWWKARLRRMAEYFDAFRIDHILGFFRIWEIPIGVSSGLYGHFSPALPYPQKELEHLMLDAQSALFLEDPDKKGWFHPFIGARKTEYFADLSDNERSIFDNLYYNFFYHRHNNFWRDSAMKKLPALLEATSMLACGEDLGMIPDCVASVMDALNILSLEVQRMPKSSEEIIANTANYPYYSVCTTSTHDMNPLRAWRMDELGADAGVETCKQIINEHIDCPSMLTVLPLQDWLSISEDLKNDDPRGERINVPSDPNNKWCYRMHLNLERLLYADNYNITLKTMTQKKPAI